jgi:glycerol-3-phosphate acyltransferase PlsY
LGALLLGRPDLVLLCLGLAALILVRHRPNIARLIAGAEPRIGRR